MDINILIAEAVNEDSPTGDLTTDNLNLQDRDVRAKLVAKEDLILSGTVLFEKVVLHFDPAAVIRWEFKDTQLVLKGQTICVTKAKAAPLLKAERIALNFLGHLSGIATLTRCYVDKIRHTKTKILDTRKTLPGYRSLQKQAVRDGGGMNHRMNLSSAVMIKDNHIQAAGGITKAVELIREKTAEPIEVETTTLEQVKEAVSLKVSRIMLDNMSSAQMKEALALIPTAIESEASGNMNLDRIREIAELGVDYISVGALTHSSPTADISLKVEWD
ncbi:MAG: carboxylating nicotinate-nucleotide diphosphorylase [Bdellovibrionales bacterium]